MSWNWAVGASDPTLLAATPIAVQTRARSEAFAENQYRHRLTDNKSDSDPLGYGPRQSQLVDSSPLNVADSVRQARQLHHVASRKRVPALDVE